MILEIINSCLTHRLQHNPHLVYSLLYQREVFEPFRSNPSLMDIIRNIESVRGVIALCVCVYQRSDTVPAMFLRWWSFSQRSWKRQVPLPTPLPLFWRPLSSPLRHGLVADCGYCDYSSLPTCSHVFIHLHITVF